MPSQRAKEKTYLVIPFEEKERAKQAAGRLDDDSFALGFDKDHTLWYAKIGTDLSKVSAWLPDSSKIPTDPMTQPIKETFGQFLKENGLQLEGLPQNGRSKTPC